MDCSLAFTQGTKHKGQLLTQDSCVPVSPGCHQSLRKCLSSWFIPVSTLHVPFPPSSAYWLFVILYKFSLSIASFRKLSLNPPSRCGKEPLCSRDTCAELCLQSSLSHCTAALTFVVSPPLTADCRVHEDKDTAYFFFIFPKKTLLLFRSLCPSYTQESIGLPLPSQQMDLIETMVLN